MAEKKHDLHPLFFASYKLDLTHINFFIKGSSILLTALIYYIMRRTSIERMNIKQAFERYIFDCIDVSDYTKHIKTKTEKLQMVFDEFHETQCNPYNLKKYGSHKACFSNWLRGLPNIIPIEQFYDNIAVLLTEFGVITEHTTLKEKTLYCQEWYDKIAAETFSIAYKKGIETMLTNVITK